MIGDVQATCCATFTDEWRRAGVQHAVVAPGSRSTPMAIALSEQEGIRVHVVVDERSAAFCALGLGLAGTPAALLCTSGTAAANFLPALVEATQSDVPMLVLTADRPPELRDVGAPQAIDQTRLYGHHVRWSHDPGVPDPAAAGSWRSLARRALLTATGTPSGRPGPVHLNLPFREPLLGTPGPVPPPLPLDVSEVFGPIGPNTSDRTALAGVVEAIDQHRGVIVAGGRSGAEAERIATLADVLSWPVLADPTSGARQLDAAVPAFDALLRDERFAADHAPDVVVRIGRPPASKVLAGWIARCRPTVVQIGGPGTIDPGHDVAAVLAAADLDGLLERLLDGARGGATGTPWQRRWRHAAARAERAIDEHLAGLPRLTEPSVARTLAAWLPDESDLVVASSMPVRDLEWYGGRRARAHANRGANGIDGVVSTALGVALGTGGPVVALVGDIAAVHDAGALAGIARRGVDLRLVVVDNDGGGIFSFLPQATDVAAERFEQLFGTPHGTDLEQLAGAHGLRASTVSTPDELRAAITEPGPSLVRIPTDRRENVQVHDALHAAVSTALASGP